MSGLHKTLDYDGFGDRNCNVLGGFISVLSIKIKSDELKRGAGSAGKPFRRFCRIIQNNYCNSISLLLSKTKSHRGE